MTVREEYRNFWPAPVVCTHLFDLFTFSFQNGLCVSGDRCEKYYIDQIPEPTIEVSEVFWKIMFAPLTVAMDKFGHGLRQFTSSFGWFLNSLCHKNHTVQISQRFSGVSFS